MIWRTSLGLGVIRKAWCAGEAVVPVPRLTSSFTFSDTFWCKYNAKGSKASDQAAWSFCCGSRAATPTANVLDTVSCEYGLVELCHIARIHDVNVTMRFAAHQHRHASQLRGQAVRLDQYRCYSRSCSSLKYTDNGRESYVAIGWQCVQPRLVAAVTYCMNRPMDGAACYHTVNSYRWLHRHKQRYAFHVGRNW